MYCSLKLSFITSLTLPPGQPVSPSNIPLKRPTIIPSVHQYILVAGVLGCDQDAFKGEDGSPVTHCKPIDAEIFLHS